jgi:hypothetical protein
VNDYLFSYLQEHGISYTKLAERFNGMIAKLLEKALIVRQKNSISTEEMIDQSLDMKYANNLLHAMSMSIEAIDLDDALEQMAAGKPIFEKGYPVSRFKMIEVLRTWRKNKLHIATKAALEKAREFEKKQGGQV